MAPNPMAEAAFDAIFSWCDQNKHTFDHKKCLNIYQIDFNNWGKYFNFKRPKRRVFDGQNLRR